MSSVTQGRVNDSKGRTRHLSTQSEPQRRRHTPLYPYHPLGVGGLRMTLAYLHPGLARMVVKCQRPRGSGPLICPP